MDFPCMRFPRFPRASGVGKPGGAVTPLHTPQFDIAEEALAIGATLLLRCVHSLSNIH